MDVAIERALVRDAEDILKLQYLCFQQEAALYNNWTIPPLRQSLTSLLLEYDSHCILVARCGEEVVASVRGMRKDGCCHVGRLVVHPRMQRQGIGKRLLQTLEGEVPDVSRYELFTGTRSESNIRLYQSVGYKPFRKQMLSPDVELVFLEKYRVI